MHAAISHIYVQKYLFVYYIVDIIQTNKCGIDIDIKGSECYCPCCLKETATASYLISLTLHPPSCTSLTPLSPQTPPSNFTLLKPLSGTKSFTLQYMPEKHLQKKPLGQVSMYENGFSKV